jgi:hypothetical protein
MAGTGDAVLAAKMGDFDHLGEVGSLKLAVGSGELEVGS